MNANAVRFVKKGGAARSPGNQDGETTPMNNPATAFLAFYAGGALSAFAIVFSFLRGQVHTRAETVGLAAGSATVALAWPVLLLCLFVPRFALRLFRGIPTVSADPKGDPQ